MAEEKTAPEPHTRKRGRGNIQLPVATVHLALNRYQSVLKTGVTPPELALLVSIHRGDQPDVVLDIQKTGSVETTPSEEKARLALIYHGSVVEAVFPGAIPNMPETFEEALAIGEESKVPVRNLVDYDLTAQS